MGTRGGMAKDQILAQRIGDRILQERRRRGLTQEVLAGLSGIHRNVLIKAEKGQRISLFSLVRIAESLNVGVEVFLSDAHLVGH